jgi:soluble lytic murein transglycosylase-like protein
MPRFTLRQRMKGWRGLISVGLALSAMVRAAPDTRGSSHVECRSVKTPFDALIAEAVAEVAPVWAVPGSLVKAVIQQESAFQPAAVSRAGAIGLMQVLPSNALRLGVAPEALFNPGDNILAGTRLLAVLLKHYEGDVISTLVAYNARPRRPLAALPDNGETPAYVHAVLRFWDRYRGCEARHSRSAQVAPRRKMPNFPRGPEDWAGVHWA